MMNQKDRTILIELICDEQTKMIQEDDSAYSSERYIYLEGLKVKLKGG